MITNINDWKAINESVPFEHDIKDVFPDIDSQELKTMFYGSDNEEDIEEITSDIKDDVQTVIDELADEGVDYEKMTQSEFMDELEKRIEPLHPSYEKLYSSVFKELITNPNQLELKFESIKEYFINESIKDMTYKGQKIKRIWNFSPKNKDKVKILLVGDKNTKKVSKNDINNFSEEVLEYFGGAKKGVNIWKFEDLEDTIKTLLKNGVEKESLLDKINNIINSIDVVEKPELSHVVESNTFLPGLGSTVEQIVLNKYFDKAYIYFTNTEHPIVIEGNFEHLENHPDITIELDPPKLDEAKKQTKAEKALSIIQEYYPSKEIDLYGNEIVFETGDRGPRLDHGGGEDGDDWLDDYQIEEITDRYKKKYKSKISRIENDLKNNKIKFSWDVDIDEKGYISLIFFIK